MVINMLAADVRFLGYSVAIVFNLRFYVGVLKDSTLERLRILLECEYNNTTNDYGA